MSRAIRIGLAIGLSASLIAQSRNAAPPALPNSGQLLGFLNQTVGWYGRLDAEGQLADQPTDVLYVNDDRQLATQVVARSFEFARTSPLTCAICTRSPTRMPYLPMMRRPRPSDRSTFREALECAWQRHRFAREGKVMLAMPGMQSPPAIPNDSTALPKRWLDATALQ